MDIKRLETKELPNISKISMIFIPETSPVTIPEIITVAKTSNLKAKPTTMMTIPISVIYSTTKLPFQIMIKSLYMIFNILARKHIKLFSFFLLLYVNITIFGNLFSILYKNSLYFFIEKKKDIVTLSKKEYNFFNYKKGDFYGN